MKWNVKDVEMYNQAKEYVDTVFVPLVPFSFDDQMKQLASTSDFISILSMEIEKNFKGRIFLTPTFYYVNGDKEKADLLKSWIMELEQAKFKHIYFLSADSSWEKEEINFSGSFLFIPPVSLENVKMEQVQEMIKQQSSVIIDKLYTKWKNHT